MDLELRGVSLPPWVSDLTHTVRPGLTLVESHEPRAIAALLRALALRDRPRAGEIRVSGRSAWSLPVSEQASIRRRIGFAPKSTDLPEAIRVGAGLRYLAALWKVPPGPRVRQELTRWGLADLWHQPLGTLSFGERRRFILAASRVMDPSLWILEDPFHGLDVPGHAALGALLADVRLGIGPVERAVLGPMGDPAGEMLSADDRLTLGNGRCT